MRERGKVAAGSNRAFLWDDRAQTAVEHFTKHLDDLETDAAETESEHICPQQHHCAHFRFGEWIADAAGVAANKVELKLAQAIGPDANIGKFAKACADTINH